MNQHRQKQIYLFFGNQDLLVQENAEKCINDLLENRERDWCFERYDLFEMMKESGDEASRNIDEFLMNCETQPMFSDRKIIRLDHSEQLKKPNSKNSHSPHVRLFETITRILADLPSYLFLVFTSPVMRDQEFSKPLFRVIQEQGQVQKYVAYDDHSPLNWLQQRVREKGMKQ